MSDEPCRLYSMDGYIYCYAHRKGWQSDTHPRPDAACFAEITAEDVARAARSLSTGERENE